MPTRPVNLSCWHPVVAVTDPHVRGCNPVQVDNLVSETSFISLVLRDGVLLGCPYGNAGMQKRLAAQLAPLQRAADPYEEDLGSLCTGQSQSDDMSLELDCIQAAPLQPGAEQTALSAMQPVLPNTAAAAVSIVGMGCQSGGVPASSSNTSYQSTQLQAQEQDHQVFQLGYIAIMGHKPHGVPARSSSSSGSDNSSR